VPTVFGSGGALPLGRLALDLLLQSPGGGKHRRAIDWGPARNAGCQLAGDDAPTWRWPSHPARAESAASLDCRRPAKQPERLLTLLTAKSGGQGVECSASWHQPLAGRLAGATGGAPAACPFHPVRL